MSKLHIFLVNQNHNIFIIYIFAVKFFDMNVFKRILKFMGKWQFWLSLVAAVGLFYLFLNGTFAWLSFYTNHGKEVTVPNIMNFSLAQATQRLEEDNLEYEIDTSKYDPQFKPYQILKVYPLPGSNVKEGRRIFIRANAKTWKPVNVPNIVGKSKYLAFSQLELVGLKIKDTIYEPNIAENMVLRLLYKGKLLQPGTVIPRFSSIDIVIGQGLARNVRVPNLLGLDAETAKSMIKDNMFSVGNVTFDGAENDPGARIYYQVPAPNTKYDQGLMIDIWLSAKPMDSLKHKINNLESTFNKQLAKDSTGKIIQLNKEKNNNSSEIKNNKPEPHEGKTNVSHPATEPKKKPVEKEKKSTKKVVIE